MVRTRPQMNDAEKLRQREERRPVIAHRVQEPLRCFSTTKEVLPSSTSLAKRPGWHLFELPAPGSISYVDACICIISGNEAGKGKDGERLSGRRRKLQIGLIIRGPGSCTSSKRNEPRGREATPSPRRLSGGHPMPSVARLTRRWL